MATLSGEKRGVFHSLYIRVTENGQTRLVNVLDLLPSAVPMLFEDPPSRTATASQYGIATWVLAQAFLTAASYIPFNRVGSATHSLVQELALVRYLNNATPSSKASHVLAPRRFATKCRLTTAREARNRIWPP